MTTSNATLYRHTDGGYYQFLMDGQSTIDASPVVIYKHLWPFDQSVWVRPSKEFNDGRFTPVAEADVQHAMQSDRQAYQAEVSAAKAARKGAVKVQ